MTSLTYPSVRLVQFCRSVMAVCITNITSSFVKDRSHEGFLFLDYKLAKGNP